MKILILGGTGFIGPHIVEAAVAAGMTITLFNRGRSNADRFANLETLIGDRDPQKGDGLRALGGRAWDAVIDLCGYVPRIAAASAQLLADSVGQYVFVSSISVYSELQADQITEASAVGTLGDPAVEKITGETYGPLKVLCEQAAEAAMPGRTACVRPGLIVGPGDSTDRFTYWPVRLARGGEVLAPGNPADLVQIIDARDLAGFIIRVIQNRITGIFNATGPRQPLSIGELLQHCQPANHPARLTWVASQFLIAQGLRPWGDIPLWIGDESDMRGFARIDSSKAINAGLSFRPVEETADDTLAWYEQNRADKPLKAGPNPDREQEVLRLWHEHNPR